MEERKKNRLKRVREAIQGIHEYYPPEDRTPEIQELIEELYNIEQKLRTKSAKDTARTA